MSTQPNKDLEVVPNPRPGRDYEINIECPEFTCVCPRTGQPDFATIDIHYTPGESIIELKSLKLYLWTFRERGIFHEAVANEILDDLVAALDPKWMRVTADFNVRGGITMQVAAEYPDGTCGSGLSSDAIDRMEGFDE